MRLASSTPYSNTGVLAVNDGEVVDIITRIDLIHYWN